MMPCRVREEVWLELELKKTKTIPPLIFKKKIENNRGGDMCSKSQTRDSTNFLTLLCLSHFQICHTSKFVTLLSSSLFEVCLFLLLNYELCNILECKKNIQKLNIQQPFLHESNNFFSILILSRQLSYSSLYIVLSQYFSMDNP